MSSRTRAADMSKSSQGTVAPVKGNSIYVFKGSVDTGDPTK